MRDNVHRCDCKTDSPMRNTHIIRLRLVVNMHNAFYARSIILKVHIRIPVNIFSMVLGAAGHLLFGMSQCGSVHERTPILHRRVAHEPAENFAHHPTM